MSIAEELQPVRVSEYHSELDFSSSSGEGEDAIRGQTNFTAEELQPVLVSKRLYIADFSSSSGEEEKQTEICQTKYTDDQMIQLKEKKSAGNKRAKFFFKSKEQTEIQKIKDNDKPLTKLKEKKSVVSKIAEEKQTEIRQTKDTDDQMIQLKEKKSAGNKRAKFFFKSKEQTEIQKIKDNDNPLTKLKEKQSVVSKISKFKYTKHSCYKNQSPQSSRINKNTGNLCTKSLKNRPALNETYIIRRMPTQCSPAQKQSNMFIKSNSKLKKQIQAENKEKSTECFTKKSSLVKNSKTRKQSNRINRTYVQKESQKNVATHSIDMQNENSRRSNKALEEQNQDKNEIIGSAQHLSKNSSLDKNSKTSKLSNRTNICTQVSQSNLSTHSIDMQNENSRRSNKALEEQNQDKDERKGSTQHLSKNSSLDKNSKTSQLSNRTNICTQESQKNVETHSIDMQNENSRISNKALEEQNQDKDERKGSTQHFLENSSLDKNSKTSQLSNCTNICTQVSQSNLSTHSIDRQNENSRRSNQASEKQNRDENERKGSTQHLSKISILDKNSKTSQRSNRTNTCTQVSQSNLQPSLITDEHENIETSLTCNIDLEEHSQANNKSKGSMKCLPKNSSLHKKSQIRKQSNPMNSICCTQQVSEKNLPTHSRNMEYENSRRTTNTCTEVSQSNLQPSLITDEHENIDTSLTCNIDLEEHSQANNERKGSTKCLPKNSSLHKKSQTRKQSNPMNSICCTQVSEKNLPTHLRNMECENSRRTTNTCTEVSQSNLQPSLITDEHQNIETSLTCNIDLKERSQAKNKRKKSTKCLPKNSNLQKKSKTRKQSNPMNSICRTQQVSEKNLPTHSRNMEYENSRKTFKTLGYFKPKDKRIPICSLTTLKDRFHLG